MRKKTTLSLIMIFFTRAFNIIDKDKKGLFMNNPYLIILLYF